MSSPETVVATARAAFNSGRTRSVAWRVNQMRNLLTMLDENEKLICEALYKDLRKPKQVYDEKLTK